MVLFRRTSSFIERIAPHLVVGRAFRNEPTREQLEREAQAELQARIDMGRPSAEEFERTRPIPDWLLLRQPPTRPLDLLAVNLNAVVAPVPAELRLPGPREGAGRRQRSGAESAE